MTRLLRIAAWSILVLILVVTISPIQFRPITGEPADLERFAAFFWSVFSLHWPTPPMAGSPVTDYRLRRHV